jgi:O-antigen/teichoic acid export membrane protein
MSELTPELAKTLRRGTAWVAVASGLSGIADLVSTLACVWLWVSPSELGIATMATALFPVLDRLGGLGLGQAAIVDADDPRRLSSIWWTNLAASLLLLVVLVAAAPLFDGWFHSSLLGGLMIAYGAKIVSSSVHLIPEARLRRELAFDTISKLKIAATSADTATKMITAYIGAHGHPDLRIWCFVLGPIASSVTMSIGCQLVRPWRPKRIWDRAAAVAAAKFGVQLSLADLLYFAYSSADYLVIGSVFGAAAVGAYRLAYELVLDVVRLVSMVNADVAFPAFARLVNDREGSALQLVRFTRQNLVMVAPLLIVIGVAAGDLLAILYPPLGPAATTAAQILCVVGVLRSASFVLPAMLAGLGHSRDALIYNIIAAVVCPIGFVVGAELRPDLGYLSVAWAWAGAYPIAFAVLLWFAVQRTGVSPAAYLRGIAPVASWALATAFVVYLIHGAMPAAHWPRAGAVAALTAASYAAFVLASRPSAARS